MDLIYKIALTFIKNVGHVTAKNLLGHFGTAEAIFKASISQLIQVPGVGEITAHQIQNREALKLAGEQLQFIEKHNIQVLFFLDANFPRRLRNCFDAPILLYYKGTADLNHPRIVSIVGTRKASAYGKMLCKQLAEALKPHDVIVVSGLAYGIDVTAHQESLNLDIPTIGVLGHGLDRLYPHLHKQIALKMLKHGGLLTEFPLNTSPDKENFPKRNRIIAGISDVTVVVEATSKGGALITAEIANSYNRDVYAFPGRTIDEYSQGCNFLIKTNRAGLLNHPKDLLYYLGWDDLPASGPDAQLKIPVGLNDEELQIFRILQQGPAMVDEIALKTNLHQSKLAIHLLSLEMQGFLTALPGKVYRLN
ncbi:MAG: protecting protein DprA [Pedobacter sp.]|jgi:DNA processing protein|nr:protecting protein DprA [Pedobacter sp.]